MAGRFRPLLFTVICVIGAAVMFARTAAAEPVHGESSELGIRFEVLGGKNWCRPDTNVRLIAPAFPSDTIPFVQMLGRIRAVVLSQCPEIEYIVFEGVTAGRPVYAAEMSRITRWRRLINLDPVTRKPDCPTRDAAGCAPRVGAYLTVRSLIRGPSFENVELTSALEPNSDLTLRYDNVIGKLRIAPRENVTKDFATAADFAGAIVADIAEGCKSSGSQPDRVQRKDYSPRLAQRTVGCHPAQGLAAQNVVVVWSVRNEYRVFSLWAEGDARAAALKLAGRFAAAIERAR